MAKAREQAPSSKQGEKTRDLSSPLSSLTPTDESSSPKPEQTSNQQASYRQISVPAAYLEKLRAQYGPQPEAASTSSSRGKERAGTDRPQDTRDIISWIDQELIPYTEELISCAMNQRSAFRAKRNSQDTAGKYDELYNAANRLLVSRQIHSGGTPALANLNSKYTDAIGSDPEMHINTIRECIDGLPGIGPESSNRNRKFINEYRTRIDRSVIHSPRMKTPYLTTPLYGRAHSDPLYYITHSPEGTPATLPDPSSAAGPSHLGSGSYGEGDAGSRESRIPDQSRDVVEPSDPSNHPQETHHDQASQGVSSSSDRIQEKSYVIQDRDEGVL